MRHSIKSLLIGLMVAANNQIKDEPRYKIITQQQQPKKKAKLQSVKKHKAKPSNKFKGSKPIKMQTKKSNINRKR